MIAPLNWQQLSLATQMGNIGSALMRAYNCELRHDQRNRNLAYEEALNLIDLTLDDDRWHNPLPRIREIARFREVTADLYAMTSTFKVPLSELIDYCTQLVIQERLSGK